MKNANNIVETTSTVTSYTMRWMHVEIIYLALKLLIHTHNYYKEDAMSFSV